jgi:hypothetical protein
VRKIEKLPTPDQLRVQGWITMSDAGLKKGEIYHLVAERGNYTLCGLRTSPFNVAIKRVSADKKTSSKEIGNLCKHCERIERQES